MKVMKDYVDREDVLIIIHNFWNELINRLPTEIGEDGYVIVKDAEKAFEYLEYNKFLTLKIKSLPSLRR